MKYAILFVLLALAGSDASAESERPVRPSKPTEAVPPVQYRSAFEGYRPYQDQEVVAWKEVNEEVARIGGHAGVLKDPAKKAPGHDHGAKR